MVKKACIFLTIFILGLSLVGCSNKEEQKEETESVNNSFSLLYNGTEIVLGSEFDSDLIDAAYEESEVTNCAFADANLVYTYDDLEITLATIDNKSVIYDVYFITDTPETKEGIRLYDDLEMMLETYGNEYEQPLDNKYIYTKGEVELSFIVENDYIVSIEYTLLVE